MQIYTGDVNNFTLDNDINSGKDSKINNKLINLESC